MADDQRTDVFLAIVSHPEETGALWRANPFVAVAGVIGGPQSMQIERHHAGRMRAIDQGFHSARRQFPHQPFEGRHQAGLAR